MQLGTAGLTAAMAVEAITQGQVEPDSGPILVTGATGGVGLLSVALLSHLGFQVVASTGKADQHEMLKRMGADEIIDRDEVLRDADGPLASARWAAASMCRGDTLRKYPGPRATGCRRRLWLVGGVDFTATVYPFLLRGVTLAGIDSAGCPEPSAPNSGTAWPMPGHLKASTKSPTRSASPKWTHPSP
ncbi:MAG: hypothetical protein CM1200mP2_56590 [Planctomycetaceae bacterium]|nr:MAG: hypothetical protein CM1200mP2_56590 [Planctomycetaceae bacterium]